MIENVSLPPEVEKHLDARTSTPVAGDLDAYARLQAADALGTAAANPGGAATAAVPPPLPGSTQWYLGLDGAQVGPLGPAEVAARVADGSADAASLVWCSGMAAWTPLGEVPELHGATPPPLPPRP